MKDPTTRGQGIKVLTIADDGGADVDRIVVHVRAHRGRVAFRGPMELDYRQETHLSGILEVTPYCKSRNQCVNEPYRIVALNGERMSVGGTYMFMYMLPSLFIYVLP